jgi:predicted nucleic acid-binding protein
MSQAVLLDAGPLIHLDELGRLDFFRCFDEILGPAEVWSEASRHRPKLRPADLTNAAILETAPAPSARLRLELERFNLDDAESAALSWLERLGGGTMISDDGDARLLFDRIKPDTTLHATAALIQELKGILPD